VRVENRFRQFGGSFGGPLYLPRFGEGGPAFFSGKNRLFFFFSYEGLREKGIGLSNQFVETPQFRDLLRTSRPNSVTTRILNSQGIDPRILSVIPVPCSTFNTDPNRCRVVAGGLDIGSPTGALGQYVTPATGGGFDGVPDIQFAQIALPRRTTGNQYNLRFDYIAGKHTFTLSGYRTPLRTFSSDSAAQGRPGADTRFEPTNSSAAFAFIRTLSPSVINEARFNVTRFYSNQLEASSEVDYSIPRVEVEGFLPGGARVRFGAPRGETSPAIFAQNTYEFRDTLTWVRGNQAWKFGAEIRREQDNNNLLGGARPLFSFVGLFNLANDTPIFEAINTDPVTGRATDLQRYLRIQAYGFFFQDDWKVRPNLTLNLGLRYEYYTPPRETQGRITNFVLGPNFLLDARVEVRDKLYKSDRNNFAPRLGFAYSPSWFGLSGDRVVVRGGFGIAYNRTPTVAYSNIRGNPPFFARNSPCCGSATNPFVINPAGLPSILYALSSDGSIFGYPTAPGLRQGVNPQTNQVIGSQVEVYGTTPELPNAYLYNYSLEAQAELPFSLTATLGYQGSAGRKFIRIVPYRFIYPSAIPPLPPGTILPFGPLFIITPDVNTNYNALNARLTRRLNRGLQFDAIYRWAKSIDTLSFEGPGFVTNQTFPQDQSQERGPSDYDVRHSFTLSSLYEVQYFRNRGGLARTLLDGWQINSVVTAHTGFPWTPLTRRPSLVTPGGRTLSPIRPIAFLGGNLNDTSDDAFTRPFGNFPGGGSNFFLITGSVQRPGIGRNTFRGPNYFNVDLSLVKRTYLPFIKEGAFVDLRANFFNAFNMLNLENFAFGGAGTIIEDANFGRSPRGLAGRVVELQARFSF